MVSNLKIRVDANNRIVVKRKVLVDGDRLERPTGKITTLPAIFEVTGMSNKGSVKVSFFLQRAESVLNNIAVIRHQPQVNSDL